MIFALRESPRHGSNPDGENHLAGSAKKHADHTLSLRNALKSLYLRGVHEQAKNDFRIPVWGGKGFETKRDGGFCGEKLQNGYEERGNMGNNGNMTLCGVV